MGKAYTTTQEGLDAQWKEFFEEWGQPDKQYINAAYQNKNIVFPPDLREYFLLTTKWGKHIPLDEKERRLKAILSHYKEGSHMHWTISVTLIGVKHENNRIASKKYEKQP